MANSCSAMHLVLEGYAKFLREKDLALPKHQPYLVHWVREFLVFAQAHGGYTFEQTLDMFLAEIGKRDDIKSWQIQQAADAVRIYRYQYRGAKDDGEGGIPTTGLNDDAAILVRRSAIHATLRPCLDRSSIHWTSAVARRSTH